MTFTKSKWTENKVNRKPKTFKYTRNLEINIVLILYITRLMTQADMDAALMKDLDNWIIFSSNVFAQQVQNFISKKNE